MIKTFVFINDPRWDGVKIDYAKIVRVAAAAALGENTHANIIKSQNAHPLNNYLPTSAGLFPFVEPNREISIILTGDSEIRKLNKKYRGIDKPTNVLSFETGDDELLGDIYISFDTAMRESAGPEFIAHVAHLVVHGVLHLLGHDHAVDSEAEKMEALEIKILAKLGIKNPYE